MNTVPLSALRKAVLAGVVLGTALAWPVVSQPADAQESGIAVTARICSSCHSIQIVADSPRDFDNWHETVQKMIDRGAKGTPEEFEAVMEYLFANLTTIDVNHGDMDELMTVLHASQSDAQAIIARRVTRPFKDLAELEGAVPGLDKTLLDAKKKMIFFQ